MTIGLKQVRLKVCTWLRKKILDPLLQILRRGAEPKQLAFSGALGITLGIFPICGVTIFLCGLAIALLGSLCHAPTVMLANFIATPIELSLIIPFLRFGESITGGSHFSLTSDALKKVFTGEASHELLLSILRAQTKLWRKRSRSAGRRLTFSYGRFRVRNLMELLGWIVAAPFILAGLYILFLPFFAILVSKFSGTVLPSSPKIPLIQPHAELKVKVRDV